MPEKMVSTLKSIAKINNTEYPMYCGFMSAVELEKVAAVPRFLEEKDHMQIATDVLSGLVSEWQRPLNPKKLREIKKIYSRDTKDNLMANPVLLGVAKPNIGGAINVRVQQHILEGRGGEAIPVEDMYIIKIGFRSNKKPLWILDGQHRIFGMIDSVQHDSPIPFVLLYDEVNYTPPFLAEIFTQVTTKATPMQPLHGEWMKYSFQLEKYEQLPHRNAAKTVLHMCKETYFGGIANPFQNKIQLNPYQPQPGFYAFTFNLIDWQKIFVDHYFGKNGTHSPEELASQVVTVIKAFESCDRQAGNTSKVFSNLNHMVLAEGFLEAFLTYIRNTNTILNLQEWKEFFKDNLRNFHKCDWSLPFVTPMSMSGSYGKHSKVIAANAFQLVFSDPDKLHGVLLTDFLRGVDACIKLMAFKITDSGHLSRQDKFEREYMIGSRSRPFQVNEEGIDRELLRVVSGSKNCQILGVYDPSVQPRKRINAATQHKGFNLENFDSGREIEVDVMSYSGDTEESIRVQIRK